MIPTRENTNPQDPEEHVLWALVAMAGPAPLVAPLPMMKQWSKHLWDCGFRHHPELQTIRYVPPAEDAPLMGSVAGSWVPVGGGEADEIDQLIDGLDPEVVARIVERPGVNKDD